MHKIEIGGVLNGWIVKVGCQTVVFSDMQYMLEEIERYIENPKATEKEYMENAKNKTMTAPEEAVPDRPADDNA